MDLVKSEIIHNHQLQLAHDFVQYTGRHIFLTGKAGTGKTTFLHRLKEQSPKRMIVVAPTGVAAINAGGVTIHSFFQIPFGPWVPGYTIKEQTKSMRFSREKRNIIKSLDLLIIDEISMVRADLLDSIDEVLRRFRRNSQPFGGVQLLMIGDMQQLPPVIKDQEWSILSKYYKTAFFFSSLALQQTTYTTITLQHVYRQSDQRFISILNKIRDKQIGPEVIEALKQRYQPGFNGEDDNYVILTTHNAKAKRINENKLKALQTEREVYEAAVDGIFPEYNYPTELQLELKVGSQVMFIKNDPFAEKAYYNGKLGVVSEFTDDGVLVDCAEDDHPVLAPKIEWQNVKYTIDEETKEINENVEGTFFQIPLKLAWAITIHKSQGLTFDKVIIDSEAAFAHGQVYVALSRCRSLEGLVLSTPFSPDSLKNNQSIDGFNKFVTTLEAGDEELQSSRIEFQFQLLNELFSFDQMNGLLYRFYKILQENQSSLPPDAAKEFYGIIDGIRPKIIQVSEQFRKQMIHYGSMNEDAENNEALQERIKKAVIYFTEQISGLISSKLDGISFETDNKEVKKVVAAAEDNLMDEILYKETCLQACQDGFRIKEYLKARAEASLEGPVKKRKRKKTKPEVSSEIYNQDLYNRLKEWRDKKAAETGLPSYMILQLKTMRALSNQVPTNTAELKLVHGFGKKKLDNYGIELLELLIGYKENNDVVIPEPDLPEKTKKKPKKHTTVLSLEMWRSGKNIAEIASERGMAETTIEGHLAHFVGKGELEVSHFVEPEKLALIIGFFEELGEMPLSTAKDHLGEEITYSDLRFVKEFLIYREKNRSENTS